jgi:mono/diheme cytochrome c family protein
VPFFIVRMADWMAVTRRTATYFCLTLAAPLVLGALAAILTTAFAYAQTGVAKAPGASNAQISQGELEFRLYCAQCHGMEATGNGPVARALKKKPANLRQLTRNNGGVFPLQEVREFIDGTKDVAAHGNREMPIWGIAFQHRPGTNRDNPVPPLSAAEVDRRIDALVDYVKSIQTP